MFTNDTIQLQYCYKYLSLQLTNQAFYNTIPTFNDPNKEAYSKGLKWSPPVLKSCILKGYIAS